MSLAETVLRIGPFNVPVWLIGVLAGIAGGALVQRTVLRSRLRSRVAANDALSTAAIAALLVWKLTPVVTRFPEIAAAPARLLYYPGGPTGLIAGVVAGVAAGVLSVVRWVRTPDTDKAASAAAESADASDASGDSSPRSYGMVALQAMVPIVLAAVFAGVLAMIPTGGGTALPETMTFLEGYGVRADGAAGPGGSTPAAGRPAVVTAWATWCGPCTAQMPEIERFHALHGDEVLVVALNLTATEGSLRDVRSYMEEAEFSFPVALDERGSLGGSLEIRSTPTTIVFDADGSEVARRSGAVNAEWLTRRVLPLVR